LTRSNLRASVIEQVRLRERQQLAATSNAAALRARMSWRFPHRPAPLPYSDDAIAELPVHTISVPDQRFASLFPTPPAPSSAPLDLIIRGGRGVSVSARQRSSVMRSSVVGAVPSGLSSGPRHAPQSMHVNDCTVIVTPPTLGVRWAPHSWLVPPSVANVTATGSVAPVSSSSAAASSEVCV
jgi:hypothetical protein